MYKIKAIPHNSKCRYGERGAADAKPKAQIILCAAKVSAASGGYSEPKQGQRSQSARGFCSRSTMRVPQPDIIEHFDNADAMPQPPERCLSRQVGIVRCCLKLSAAPGKNNFRSGAALIFFHCEFWRALFLQKTISEYRGHTSARASGRLSSMWVLYHTV